MISLQNKRLLLAATSIALCTGPALGHLTYSNRVLGTFSGLEPQSNTITGQTTMNWTWADGTDGDFGHSHGLKFFRFTLENPASVTISVAALDPALLLPAFSLYSGLAHASPPDYENNITFQYLATLPGAAKEGAFNALATWKMGNDVSQSFDDFSTFTYMGNAADGTPLNFGSAPGIDGDGLADGAVSRTFALPAGSYSLAVGGAMYSGQGSGAPIPGGDGANEGASSALNGMNVGVAVVPEPATALLALGSLLFLGTRRQRAAMGR